MRMLNVSNVNLMRTRKKKFSSSIEYGRVDRTVWKFITLSLAVAFDPHECRNPVRHLNATRKKLEQHLFTPFRTKLEYYELSSLFANLILCTLCRFTYMPADKDWF